MPVNVDLNSFAKANLEIVLVGWIGHTFLTLTVLNYIYAQPWPKSLLKKVRLILGCVILSFPVVAPRYYSSEYDNLLRALAISVWSPFESFPASYFSLCLLTGLLIFPFSMWRYWNRSRPKCLLSQKIQRIDFWPTYRSSLIGDGYWRWLTRLPGNGVFDVEFTELTLAPRNLPPEWDGLTILHLADLHFHGTPSQLFFQEVFRQVETADVVVLAGDFVDSNTHHGWLSSLLGCLQWRECGLAILGNHDQLYNPDSLRNELSQLGYQVLGNNWRTVRIRGVDCVAIGHEGPWFRPSPDLRDMPADGFRLCISHTPDNVYWAAAHRIDLMLSGHVHGGQIRLPIVGSLFVPSRYGRRFDQGTFDVQGTSLVVTRGLSGKEPLRFRCPPQVIQLTLVYRGANRDGPIRYRRHRRIRLESSKVSF